MENFLVAYDIFDKKRLPKVKKIVYSYALGGQKSALEAPLDKSLTDSLLKQLFEIIDEEDRCHIIFIIGKPILLGKAKSLEFKNNGVIIV